MARLTVEDCLQNVENRFDLVLLAAKRARQIYLGSQALVDEENDKPTVVALREIAEGLMSHETFEAIEAQQQSAHQAALAAEAAGVFADEPVAETPPPSGEEPL